MFAFFLVACGGQEDIDPDETTPDQTKQVDPDYGPANDEDDPLGTTPEADTPRTTPKVDKPPKEQSKPKSKRKSNDRASDYGLTVTVRSLEDQQLYAYQMAWVSGEEGLELAIEAAQEVGFAHNQVLAFPKNGGYAICYLRYGKFASSLKEVEGSDSWSGIKGFQNKVASDSDGFAAAVPSVFLQASGPGEEWEWCAAVQR